MGYIFSTHDPKRKQNARPLLPLSVAYGSVNRSGRFAAKGSLAARATQEFVADQIVGQTAVKLRRNLRGRRPPKKYSIK